MKKIFLILICLFIQIPVFASTSTFMEKMLNSWVGYSLEDIIQHWRLPDYEKEIAGHHIYVWERRAIGYVPQYTNSNVNSYSSYYANISSYTTGGYSVSYYCTKKIEVDKDNQIIGWEWEGNVCPSSYRAGQNLVNPDNDEWAKAKLEKARKKYEKKQEKMKQKNEKKRNYKKQS